MSGAGVGFGLGVGEQAAREPAAGCEEGWLWRNHIALL